MSLDQQTAGYKDHDYLGPKLTARGSGGSSKRQHPYCPQVSTITPNIDALACLDDLY